MCLALFTCRVVHTMDCRTLLVISKGFSEDTINAVRRNFYMDDLLASKQSSDEATGLAKDLTARCQTVEKCLK